MDFNLLNFYSIAPMAVLCAFAIFILCISVITKELSTKFYAVLSVIAVVLDSGILFGYSGRIDGFFGLVTLDGIAILSIFIMLISTALFIPLALCAKIYREYTMPEFFALFLFMLIGLQFMASSGNLILIFIGLETSSLALYALIAMHNRKKAIEAAVKYFTMGALGSGFFVFGAALFYLVCGSVEISQIITNASNFKNNLLLLTGCVFMISAIGFKLSLIPFHTWAPDVYEGTSSPLAGYISVVPKIAGFIVAIRLFEGLARADVGWINAILYCIAVITMTLTNIMALVQIDVKRMLAFSSISHAGFALSAIVIGSTQANVALFLYWILFAFANLGAFSMLWLTKTKQNSWHVRYDYHYDKFNGLVKTIPVAALVMAIFMFSLAGIPPFSVFWGKMYLMSAAINSGFIVLALIMAVNSAIAIYYYLRLIVCMFLHEPTIKDEQIYLENVSNPLKIIIAIAAFACTMAPFIVKFSIPLINSFVFLSGY